VQPASGKNEIVGVKGGALRIKINAPAVKGKANKALVEFNDTSILTRSIPAIRGEPLALCPNPDPGT